MSRPVTKPKTIEAGKCYRLFAWYGLGDPSQIIVYVYAIDGVKQRKVRCQAISPPGHELGWGYASYSEFFRMVHSEARNVMH